MSILCQRFNRRAIAVLAVCCLPLTTWADDDGAKLRAIVDGAIRPVMTEYDVPGMAVAITVDGKPAFFNYGVASRATIRLSVRPRCFVFYLQTLWCLLGRFPMKS